MKVLGIIAEYNPFHMGHAYQINTLKKEINADYTVIAMSGNFVQRGAPAMMEKYSRARMALSCGADLVLELPSIYAAASAEHFARGGVALLESAGVVTHLGFGTETKDFGLLQEIADLLNRQPEPFTKILQQGLKNGLSFPAARSQALEACLEKEKAAPDEPPRCKHTRNPALASFPRCKHTGDSALASSSPRCKHTGDPALASSSERSQQLGSKAVKKNKSTETGHILASPNNILAIEYLKALERYHSSMLPCPLLRRGQGYHDASPGQEFSSASAIRASILGQERAFSASGCPSVLEQERSSAYATNTSILGEGQENFSARNSKLDTLAHALPGAAFEILRNYPHPFLQENDFSQLLHYKLLTEPASQLSRYADISSDLARRIKKEINSFLSWSSFCSHLKSKNTTYARLSRMFLHVILNIYQEDYHPFPEPAYLRILGFGRQAAPLLAAIKSQGKLPLITSPSAAEGILDSPARTLLSQDLAASGLYRVGLAAKGDNRLKNDYQQPLALL